MKAFIIKNKKNIEPFLKLPGNLLIKNKELNILQKEALLKLGLEPVVINDPSEIEDDNEYVIFGGEVYFETELLKKFLKRSKKLNCKTVCAIKPGIFTLRTISNTQNVKKHNDRIEYNLYYYPEKKSRNDLKPVIFDLDKDTEKIFLPKHMDKNGDYQIPLTDKPIIQIDHWSNLWVANLISVLAGIARFKKNKLKLFMFALKSLSFNKWRVASRLNSLGKNCDIHPTAYIEGSILGDNVVIGAGAIIKESAIGNRSFVGNGVIVESSVIGDGCTILNGHVLYSVLYQNTFSVTHMISTSIVGQNSFIGSGAVLTDFRFDNKTVRIIKNGEKIDTLNIFLGCCLGNNVYLGAGCIVAPGRIIPNNIHVSLDKERIVTKINQNESGKMPGFRII